MVGSYCTFDWLQMDRRSTSTFESSTFESSTFESSFAARVAALQLKNQDIYIGRYIYIGSHYKHIIEFLAARNFSIRS